VSSFLSHRKRFDVLRSFLEIGNETRCYSLRDYRTTIFLVLFFDTKLETVYEFVFHRNIPKYTFEWGFYRHSVAMISYPLRGVFIMLLVAI
jgi:hypothetical protein